MKKILTIFILLVLVACGLYLRLYKIENPVADWHSWRQADTSAVTRNFVKYGVNLLYPRYDDFSDVSGTGAYNPSGYRYVEFPIFNLLHYFLYSNFSTDQNLEFWGRLTSIFAAIISGVTLFFLVRRHSNIVGGLVASAVYLLMPFNLYFTRVILPDPLMVTLFLLSLNFYEIYNKNNKLLVLLLSILFGAMAVLVKPVAIFFLLPITITQFKKHKWNLLKSRDFWIAHILFIAPFGIWRLWSYRHPEGIPASGWLLNGNGIRFKPSFFQWIFGTRIGTLILGKFGIWPMIQGLVEGNWYILSLAISAFAYLSVFATGNVHHDYYQIPIIPAISALVGVGVSAAFYSKKRRFMKSSIAVICLLFAGAFSWLDIKGLYQVNNWPIVRAGQAVDRITPPDAVVMAPYQGDTAFLYQTNRPGFAYFYTPLKDMIDKYGVTYYVSVNYDSQTREVMEKYTIVEENPEFVIVKLVEKLK